VHIETNASNRRRRDARRSITTDPRAVTWKSTVGNERASDALIQSGLGPA